MLGKIEGRRRRGCQRMRWMNRITDATNMNLGKLWEVVRNRKAWNAAVHGVAESDTTEWWNNKNKMYESWGEKSQKSRKNSVSKCQLMNIPHHLVPQGLDHWPLQSLTFNSFLKEFRKRHE